LFTHTAEDHEPVFTSLFGSYFNILQISITGYLEYTNLGAFVIIVILFKIRQPISSLDRGVALEQQVNQQRNGYTA